MRSCPPSPPVVAAAILALLLPSEVRADMLGDLAEAFRQRCAERGVWSARVFYWSQLLSFDIWRSRWVLADTPSRVAIAVSTQGLVAGAGQDMWYAARSLWRHGGFAFASILTLALGIGANSAIFSIVDAVLLTPLPYADPDRLVLFWHRLSHTGTSKAPIPSLDVLDYQLATRSFVGFAATDDIDAAVLVAGDEAQLVTHAPVTPNLFALLGVAPVLGASFTRDAAALELSGEAPGREVVVSFALWQRAFGADSSMLGRSVLLNGLPATVVGVLPAAFRLWLPPEVGFPREVDVWSVLSFAQQRGVREGQRIRDQDSDNTGVIIGRLGRGVSVEQAQSEMDAVATLQRQRFQYYERAGVEIDVAPMRNDVVAGTRVTVLALFVAVGLVLLISCLNVATLMMARASHRRRELAVRSALGASGGRIARQLLAESLVLALLGGGAGIVLARVGIDLLLARRPAEFTLIDRVGMSGTVLVFTLIVTTAAAFLFGAAPALDAMRRQFEGILARPPSGGRDGRTQVTRGSVLVVLQVALSLVLLAGAGLLLRSLHALGRVAPGFEPDGVVAFDVTLRNPERHRGPAARSEFLRQLEERLTALPGITSVAATSRLPLDGRTWTNQYGVGNQAPEEWSGNEANFMMVTGDYFAVMQTNVLAGRSFTPFDDRQDRRVVIVDRKMAERITQTGRPLDTAVGQTLGFPLDGQRVQAEVIGVVEDVRYEDLRIRGRETMYVPYRHEASRDVSLVVRTNIEPRVLTPSIQEVMRSLDPHTPPYRVRLLADHVDSARASTRFSLMVFSTFAVIALILAAVGLYGVISFGVTSRMSEFGIRIALGGRGRRVVADVVKEGMRLAVTGVVLGLAAATIGGRLLQQLVYGVQPTDPLTLLSISTVVIGVALGACFLPARRAAAADPIAVLRS